MCSTLARPFGVLTGVLSTRTTDHVRTCLFTVGLALRSRVEPDCSYKYYLAVAPLPSRTHSPEIGNKVPRPSRSCIQLWSLGPSADIWGSGDDKGEMHCEMVLCIDSGPALELKWCPLPSHDPVCPESLCYWLLGIMSQQKAVRVTSSLSEKAGSSRWRIRRRLAVGVCGSVPARSCINRTFIDDDSRLWWVTRCWHRRSTDLLQ